MFRGRSKHTLDEKGRLAIPTRFKDTLKQKEESYLMVTNYQGCLWAFAKDEWQAIEEKAARLPLMDEASNVYRRIFLSGGQKCELKQGRITIPPDLREIAGLKRDVVLVGAITFFEIWDKDRWDEEFLRASNDLPKHSQALTGFGI